MARRRVGLFASMVVGMAAVGATIGGGAAADTEGCNPQHPSACQYVSDLSYDVGVIDDVLLVDDSRYDLDVPVLVRFPREAEGPRPVIIWHHGGPARYSGKNDSEEWGNLLAAAGYVVIHPSRMLPSTPLDRRQIEECEANDKAQDEPTCAQWLAGPRYGPMTTEFIYENLDVIEREAEIGGRRPLEGLLDHETIAVGGHSGGSPSVHVNAGAWQQWDRNTPRYEEPFEEAVAFLATGPHGPMYSGFNTGFQSRDGDAGFQEHSWVRVDRPFMFVTGVGDETNEPPEARATGFLTSIGNGNKYLLWNTAPQAVHETMNIHKCDSEIQAAHCGWIGSAGLAYFDAVVRGRRHAEKWLASNSIDILTGGAIELHRR